MFKEAFYGKKDLGPQLRKNEDGENVMTVPEGVDAELLAKVLANPEMEALLLSIAKTMKFRFDKKHENINSKFVEML